MNLDQIATKCFILALFIRDDGERLLLGDGFYDFNQKLQHFQANTIANDVVEIQGDSGQLLAGQVMRSGAQKFEGYIGDATTNRQTIEQKRSDFMAFFRIKHFYKVIYILPDGTAIQRRRGYLTDAPTIPEIFQKFPEYSVALNFEDANYYEYAEDDHGDEIYAHIAELALAGEAIGGLVWDAIGAVSNGISWSGIQTAQGEYIQVTNDLDIPAKLASVEMLGKAEQDGTPTPDAPVAVETTTGENVVKIEGKNLSSVSSIASTTWANTNDTIKGILNSLDVGTYTISMDFTLTARNDTSDASIYGFFFQNSSTSVLSNSNPWGTGGVGTKKTLVKTFDITAQSEGNFTQVYFYGCGISGVGASGSANVERIQIELGSTATTYEPYQGQTLPVNLGKNLADPNNANIINAYIRQAGITVEASNRLVYYKVEQNSYYTISATRVPLSGQESAQDNMQMALCSDIPANGVATYDIQQSPYLYDTTLHASFTVYTGSHTYLALKFANIARTDASATLATVQLERGNNETSFAPYFTPIELAKIGNYQDRIYKDDGKWYIEKQVGKVVLDGSESWARSQSGTTNLYAYWLVVPNSSIPNWNTTTPAKPKLCDNFTYKYEEWKTVTSPCLCENSGLTPNMCIFSGFADITTIADWQTWLASNPTTVYYALATPTTTEITNEALIAQLDALGTASLYLGVNNIGTETQNAVPTLKIEYYTEVDLDGAGYEWEPGGNTAKTIVTVAGVDSAWPIWTVQGGAQNPTLTNITTGQTISWQGFVPEGQTLTINMAEMTADLAGANVFEYITGEWIRLAPGNNTLVYNAGNADKPSTLSWNGVLA